MIRKLVSIAVLAACAASPAMALTNPGFEDGTTGWSSNGGSLSALSSGSAVTVTDGGYLTYSPYTVNVDAMAGDKFGMLTTSATTDTTSYGVHLGGPVSADGDTFWMRLMAYEYEAKYNDSMSVTFIGAALGAPVSYTWSTQDTLANGGFPDSGWKGYSVPLGTDSIVVSVNNKGDQYNLPVGLIDYQPAAPVPEADISMMMLAGLGALGFVSRRRAKKTA